MFPAVVVDVVGVDVVGVVGVCVVVVFLSVVVAVVVVVVVVVVVRLIIGMNDKSDSARRQFIEYVESELRDNQHLFRATWEETTCDFSWHMINDCILKHGKRHFKA